MFCSLGFGRIEYVICNSWLSSNPLGFDGQMGTRHFDLVKVTFPGHGDVCVTFWAGLSYIAWFK